jgi:hypothetical protein
MAKGEITLNIQRVFKGSQDFKSLIIIQLEKEIEKLVAAAYNDSQVDIVAINMEGDNNENIGIHSCFN